MREKLFKIFDEVGVLTYQQAQLADKILSLLGENEIVVLDAPEVEHVGLLDVRGSDASEVKETAIEQTSGAAFREIIEDGNICQYQLCTNTARKEVYGLKICNECYERKVLGNMESS